MTGSVMLMLPKTLSSCPQKTFFLLQFFVPASVALESYANKGVNRSALSKLSPVYERHLEWICIIY